jgi:hypothetical protein
MSASALSSSGLRSRGAALVNKFLGRDGVHRTGVRGWLILICVVLTIINPLITSTALSLVLKNLTEYSFNFGPTSIVIAGYVMIAGNTAICGYGIYAGYALWNIRPKAVRHAKRFLISLLLIPLITDGFMLFAGQTFPQVKDYAITLVGNTLWTLFYFAIFILIVSFYFDRSGRVSNTYQ